MLCWFRRFRPPRRFNLPSRRREPRLRTAPARAAPRGTAPRLTVFGVPQTTASVVVPAGKLDGALRDVAQRYPTLATDHPVRSPARDHPAARFRLSTPLTTPEVSIDAIATGNPQALKSALESLGLRDTAVYSNDVGGWLPVDQLANASALAELRFARAAMPRTRSSIVATQGDFAQQSSAIRASYPSLTGAGVTVGVLSDSFNCFAQYAGARCPPRAITVTPRTALRQLMRMTSSLHRDRLPPRAHCPRE